VAIRDLWLKRFGPREILLVAPVLVALSMSAGAQDASWKSNPASGDFNTRGNWDQNRVPLDTAIFGASSNTHLTFSDDIAVGSWNFNSGAYTFDTGLHVLAFVGAGIVVNGGSVNITNNGNLNFANGSAGSATVVNNSNLSFNNSSIAGNASITNTSTMFFSGSSTAANATIANNHGFLDFFNTSMAGSASIANNATVRFNNASTAGSATINNARDLGFNDTSTAGASIITNSHALNFANASTAGAATITNNDQLVFKDTSTAGGATITNNRALNFLQTSTAGSATITNNADLFFNASSTAGRANIVNVNTSLIFFQSSSAESATITNTQHGAVVFTNDSKAASATIVNSSGSLLAFTDNSTANSATITANGDGTAILMQDNANGGTARFIVSHGSILDISPLTSGGTTAGSIEGGGVIALGANNLAVGGNNRSTTFSGIIQDGGAIMSTGGSLTKTGTGTLTLSGVSTYTHRTVVDGGTLTVNGSITSPQTTRVNAGGTLSGFGSLRATTINPGGTLAPVSSSQGTLTMQGNLVFLPGADYLLQFTPTGAGRANVTGFAVLAGNVDANLGGFTTKQNNILHAAGGLNGSFAGSSSNSTGFTSTLSQTSTDVFLNLTAQLGIGSTLTVRQQNLANTINDYFNGGGTLPPGLTALFNLSGSNLTHALTQVSGETATGAQQTTFNAMNQFMGVMSDPFIAGRGGFGGSGASAMPFAEESEAASGYGSEGRKRSNASERDAYAMFAKAPPPRAYEPRWSVWASGFGGAQTTDGNAAAGSNTATSRIFGTAVGADYLLSPNTIAGFALSGGGTSFSVTNGGSGRSDLFQAGAFVNHTIGAAYLSAALAYGWQDVTTDRTLALFGVDRLRAEFNANAFSGRVEGGYRFVTPWLGGVGLTPYVAGQFTRIHLPAYAESVVSGADSFALSYHSKSTTAPRSEIGFRADRSFAMRDSLLTLRGRAAWAHDYNSDRSIAATFQALPGASFVVGGATPASDAALLTASAERKWLNGFSLAATFEGEFSQATRSYAGKGVARYAW
jgi:autotransporter-associated beta strand protein